MRPLSLRFVLALLGQPRILTLVQEDATQKLKELSKYVLRIELDFAQLSGKQFKLSTIADKVEQYFSGVHVICTDDNNRKPVMHVRLTDPSRAQRTNPIIPLSLTLQPTRLARMTMTSRPSPTWRVSCSAKLLSLV